jgi:hypothetical protein
MNITLTFTVSAAMVVGFSVLCLVLVTAFCVVAGLFNGPDPYRIGWVFGLIVYVCGWVVPSLVAWAVWATWFRGGAT